MAYTLRIDGTTMPTPASITVKREKVWSSGTRRSSSAKMQGKIVAIKCTLSITFPAYLSQADLNKIKNAVDNTDEWHSVTFTNEYNETETKNFYFGNPEYSSHFYANGRLLFDQIVIEAVQR